MALPVNISTIPGMIVYANSELGMFFGILVFASLWLTLFFAMKQYDTGRAFLAASFICLFLSLIAVPFGLSTSDIWGIFLVLTIIGIAYAFLKKEGT